MWWPFFSCGGISVPTPPRQPDVQDRQVGLMAFAEFDRFIDGASDAAHLITAADEYVLKHVSHEEVVLGNHDLSHCSVPFGNKMQPTLPGPLA